jgi:hypothetical protein
MLQNSAQSKRFALAPAHFSGCDVVQLSAKQFSFILLPVDPSVDPWTIHQTKWVSSCEANP